MNEMIKKIYFYYPSRNIGGAQVLFVRLANYFAINSNIDVYIVDYDNGYLKNNKDGNVGFVSESDFGATEIQEKALVICPLSLILEIKRSTKNFLNIKFLFWCIHPENTIDILRGAQRLKFLGAACDFIVRLINYNKVKVIRSELCEHLANNEIMFMDYPNLSRTSSYYNVHVLNPTYVPIPISANEKKIHLTEACERKNEINVIWIGRLSIDKVYSLLYVVKKFDSEVDYKVNFHIVGDGEASNKIKYYKTKNINLIMHGVISNDKLPEFIEKNKISVAFGMGTSILETARLCVPSIIVDPSYSDIPRNYTPRWLFNTKFYNLGSFEHEKGGDDFHTMIKLIVNDEYNELGNRCFDYVVKHHDISSVFEKLQIVIKKLSSN